MTPRVSLALSLLCLVLFAGLADAQQVPALPFSPTSGGGGASASSLSGTFLRLDASNDPLTSQLSINQPTPDLITPTITTPANTNLVIAPGSGGRGISINSSTSTTLTDGVTISGTAAALSGATSILLNTSVSSATDRFPLRVTSAAGNAFRVAGNGDALVLGGVFAKASSAAGSPAYGFTGTTTGLRGGANTLSFDVAGTEQAFIGSTGVMTFPNASNGIQLTGNDGGQVSMTGSTLQALTLEGGGAAPTAATVGLRSGVIVASPVDGHAYVETMASCAGQACNTGTRTGAILTDDANGSSTEGIKVVATAINLGSISGHRNTVPQALPTCTAALSGDLRYKEDTDTAATAPALCLCSRDNAAIAYSWKVINGAGTCP